MGTSERRILVVDDEVDIRDNLSDILTEFGYKVDTAEDAPSALALVERHPYEVALLDLRLPGMDGIELYRRLRERRPATVALLLTAYASPTAAREAIAAGAWRVLSKPIDPSEILRLIDAALGLPLVLVVDDDRELCATLWDLFRENGFRVALAHNIDDLASDVAGTECEIALIDLKLADGDGLRALELIHRDKPQARTILITAFRDEMAHQIQAALERGVDGICYKPFEPAELIHQIQRLTARPASEP